jgi:hypothetical protein
MKKVIFFIILIIFFHSCENKKSRIAPSIVTENKKILNLSEESVNGLLTQYFELESVVPIATDNELLLTKITKVIPYKDKLIILDVSGLICIINSNTGEKELVINRKGNGPGESKVIMDIAIDEESENILAFNDYHKLLFFNFQGDFLREEYFQNLWESIIYDSGKIKFHNKLTGGVIYPYLFQIYDLKTKEQKETGLTEDVDFMFRISGRQIVKSKNIWFSSWFGYDMCMLKDTSIIFSYNLKPAHPITKELAKKLRSNPPSFFREISENSIICGISSIRETDNFLVFKSNQLGLFLVDKAKSSVYHELIVYDDNIGVHLPNYYPHDGDDNRIMFIVQPNVWINRTVNPNKIPSHLVEKINSTNINEDDNPVLLFYKEKQTAN